MVSKLNQMKANINQTKNNNKKITTIQLKWGFKKK